MLNKKQTLFNKKLTMFNVFLFLAIVFSSIVCFVPLVTQKEINTDLACESGTAVESITENILQLNYVSSKNIKPSSDRYVSDEYLDQGSWEVDGVDTGHVSGGTYIVIEYNTTANVWEITYTYKGENTIKSYIANNGYELTSIKVLRGDSGGVLAFTIVINQTRIEKILNASDEVVTGKST